MLFSGAPPHVALSGTSAFPDPPTDGVCSEGTTHRFLCPATKALGSPEDVPVPFSFAAPQAKAVALTTLGCSPAPRCWQEEGKFPSTKYRTAKE